MLRAGAARPREMLTPVSAGRGSYRYVDTLILPVVAAAIKGILAIGAEI